MKKIAVIIVIAAISCGAGFLMRNKERTGYIQIQRVFNEFAYKKEMEQKLKKVEEIRQKELDSLELSLKILLKEVELNHKDPAKTATFQAHRDEFLRKKGKYADDYEKAVAQYDEIIIKQMNHYIKEYGEKNAYTYIFGTDGNGTLMYADSTSDLTQEVVAYINQKYKGK